MKNTLRVDHRSDILSIVDGNLLCPQCGRGKVQRVTPETRARNLVVFCKRCGVESIVNIEECLCQVPVPNV